MVQNEGESSVIQTTVACKRMDEMSWNFIHKLVTDKLLEMSHVHFLVALEIEKSRDFSAHVVQYKKAQPNIYRVIYV